MTDSRPRICLFEPRIPQNTGNISRTCAAFNYKLDLIRPLGFSLEDKYLKRAGLDYWPFVDMNVHNSFSDYKKTIESSRIIGFSRFSTENIIDFKFNSTDILLFGREDNGLPKAISKECNYLLSIPMPGGVDNNNKGGVRSLNLSVACGIVIYKTCEHLKLY